MKNEKVYFALWAEDINQYLRTGYNFRELSKIRIALLEYISVDQDNPENIDQFNLIDLLSLTGLDLDYSREAFEFRNKLTEKPSDIKDGKQVNISFLE